MEIEQFKMELCKIDDIKKKLVECSDAELSKGVEHVDAKELGYVVDMIKDLAQTKASCWEAKYYEAVVTAMEEGSEDRYGYNNRRYSSGRYAPKGSGHMGYSPTISQMPYVDKYLSDPDFDEMMFDKRYNSRMGYTEPNHHYVEGTDYKFNHGYTHDPRYGKSYNDYVNSRRHYTDTRTARDKEEMDRHAMEHLTDMATTLRDMYKASDVDMKKRIREDFTKLMEELKN